MCCGAVQGDCPSILGNVPPTSQADSDRARSVQVGFTPGRATPTSTTVVLEAMSTGRQRSWTKDQEDRENVAWV